MRQYAADSEVPSWLTRSTLPGKGICRATPALLTRKASLCVVPPLLHRYHCLQGIPQWGSGRTAALSAHSGEGPWALRAASLEPLTLSSATPSQGTGPHRVFWAQLQVLPPANKMWLDIRKKLSKAIKAEQISLQFLSSAYVLDWWDPTQLFMCIHTSPGLQFLNCTP